MRGARPELKLITDDKSSDPEHFANLHKVENGSGAEPFNPAEPEGLPNAKHVSPLAEPPVTLSAELQEKWRRTVGDLKERRLWKDSMESLVTSFVLAGATVERLELKIAIEGEQVPGAGGAQKPHPGTGLLRSSRQTLERLGAELGITPTSRARKSLQPGPDLFTRLNDEWDL